MTREEALAALTARPEPFERNGFACTIHPPTAGDILAARTWSEKHGADTAYQLLFVRSVRNGDGSRLFTDEDAALVEGLSHAHVDEIMTIIYRMSGLGGEAKKAHSIPETSS